MASYAFGTRILPPDRQGRRMDVDKWSGLRSVSGPGRLKRYAVTVGKAGFGDGFPKRRPVREVVCGPQAQPCQPSVARRIRRHVKAYDNERNRTFARRFAVVGEAV